MSHRLSPITAPEDDGYKPPLRGGSCEARDRRRGTAGGFVSPADGYDIRVRGGPWFGLPSPGELEQGCQTLSGKGQRVNILSFAGHMFSVTAVLLYGSSRKPPQTFISQRAWLGFRNTLAPIRH